MARQGNNQRSEFDTAPLAPQGDVLLSEVDRIIATLSERIDRQRHAARDHANFETAMQAIDALERSMAALDRLQELRRRIEHSDVGREQTDRRGNSA